MSFATLSLGLFVSLLAPVAAAGSERVHVDSVQITLLEDVDVPAEDSGALGVLHAEEGDLVEAGDRLATLDDTAATLELERAESELEVARDLASNDARIRFAEKAVAVAEAEYQRAKNSIAKFEKAVSQTELDRLRLAAEKTVIEVELAKREQHAAELEARVKNDVVRLARHYVERRKINAPITGIVVQVNRRPGEWVETAETVFRMVRVNRLRAEAFVDARLVSRQMAGRRVSVSLERAGKVGQTFSGKLVFVSPEINPVNGQVRIWAEVDNPDLILQPGQQASMVIEREIVGEGASEGPKTPTAAADSTSHSH